ncbi:MAG: DUF362 domain-containing protein [Butyricicoccus sp.]|nr:DUF362 domain-containing protein [Butyricicoccus sp.]
MSKVYFTRELTPEAVVRMYEVLGVELEGRVAVKVHSGETGNQNFLRPEFLKKAIDRVGGTVVECNTAYEGTRNHTKIHFKTMAEHGWSKLCKVDILDAGGEMELPVENGRQIKVNYVGRNLADYDSMLVLSHFKGHPMGGFGGALKNISIGLASSHGKAYIHGAGYPEKFWDTEQDVFLEAMADADRSVVDHMKGRGAPVAYVNIMKNMSVDCDCCAVAADPKIGDIGILSSLDPVALDQACVDLVYASDDPGKADLIERMESRHGIHILEAAAALGVGSREYELVELD